MIKFPRKEGRQSEQKGKEERKEGRKKRKGKKEKGIEWVAHGKGEESV